MKKIAVWNTNRNETESLEQMLLTRQYETVSIGNFKEIEHQAKHGAFVAAIIDIDSVEVSNLLFRELAGKAENLKFICISSRRFHPDLEEALRTCIYACLTKPVKPDELFFCLSSIIVNMKNAK